jgi:hypothetical protein
MSNRDLIVSCKNHFLHGLAMIDKCGLNGEECILVKTKQVYATPETQRFFGNFRSKAVPINHTCANWVKDELPPFESACEMYKKGGVADKYD